MAKLLIVDDDKYFISSLKKLINWNKAGVSTVFSATNIMDAKTVIEKNKINILLCDIEMTNENGFELVNWLSQNYSSCKVILLTGYADFLYANKAIKYGCVDYILKPVAPEELLKAINKAIKLISIDTKISSLSILNEFRKNFGEITVNKFWIDILNGTIDSTSDAIVEAANSRKIPFSLILQFQTAMVKIFTQRDLDFRNEVALSYEVDKALHDIVKNCSSAEIIRLSNDSFFILFDPYEFDYDSLKSKFSCNFNEVCNKYSCKVIGFCDCKVYATQIYGSSHILKRRFEFTKSMETGFYKINTLRELKNVDTFMESIENYQFKQTEELIRKIPFEKADMQLDEFCYAVFEQLIDDLDIKDEQATVLSKKINYNDVELSSQKSIKEFVRAMISKAYVFSSTIISEDSIVSKCISYINNHLDETLTREEIANNVHLNSDYLNRLFQKSCRTSIIEYVNKSKIEKACTLLKDRNMLISDVSKQVGYDNFSSFSTLFKKKVGVSPTEYRSKMLVK